MPLTQGGHPRKDRKCIVPTTSTPPVQPRRKVSRDVKSPSRARPSMQVRAAIEAAIETIIDGNTDEALGILAAALTWLPAWSSS